MSRDRLVWALRAVWAIQPIVGGALFAEALDAVSRPVAITAMVGLWFGWAVALGASLITLPVSLIVLRPIIAFGPVMGLWAVIIMANPANHVWAIIAGVTVSTVAAALAMSPAIGDRFVDGGSYGDERRMLLRPPVAVLAGPVELAGLVAVGGLITGPLLLAAQHWWLGGIALVIGVPLSVFAFRAMNGLVQRWVVFVPAGVVLRDAATLVDPVLFRREGIRFVGPALAKSDATDLRAGASGVPLELSLVTTTAIPAITERSAPVTPVGVDGVIFAPSLPGECLAEADRRGLEVQ